MLSIIFGLISAAAAVTTSAVAAHKTGEETDKARSESLDIANKNRKMSLNQQRISNRMGRENLSLREDQLAFDQGMAVKQQRENELSVGRTAQDAMRQRKNAFEDDRLSRLFEREESASRLFV